ncbi:23S rRNA pseudouridine955/2504/2580 synthase/23S rRNA pseudouridine1911/1915/1917 synthase [Persephonella hydrogeniphila]|uniref:23S rRNA pseudouridine955/2504/2580 synthase/23S rRNA pseudouridine1911/1915/1917 synthase n=1 Tax=Persephonella hydrogeniphila TaxID=198703 RepID=A0A285MZ85_9AQUI|nr:RluA family pseudouridine synthase [Persephonella hydrogeniphila]SNZ02504.1 23S rRNA pseudouridine955/2504/2580 synthase/23S rRNA pseudouridine1911/1915/1917 synthase [Persephonella hydrogeniphila]
MKKLKVKKETSLKDFVASQLGVSKNRAKELIDSRTVFVNNKRVWIASHQLKSGDIVELPVFEKDEKWSIEKNILYEDNFIIAVNKPPFLESENKKGSVEDLLRSYKKDRKIRAIHRLDKETSGVLLFAKNSKIFERFKKLWQEKKIHKQYLALSHEEADFKKKVINIPVDGKLAKSFVYTLKTSMGFSLFKVEIPTGRKHQIRIHLSKIRHPVVGDKIYGLKNITNPILKNVKRHMLHSYIISFYHPFLKKKITIKAKLFKDFENFGKSIRLL